MPKKSIYRQPGAQHFQLVHRSQRDPLINDPDASQRLLKPVERANDQGRRTATLRDLEDVVASSSSAAPVRQNEGEAAAYGVYYDDSAYDYMQHLRSVGDGDGEAVLIAPKATGNRKGKGKQLDEDAFLKPQPGDAAQSVLPASVLPSAQQLSREDTLARQAAIPAELQGLQPDMDPHLRQVLEALEDEAFVDEQGEEEWMDELLGGGERAGGEETEEWEFDEDGIDSGDEEGDDEAPKLLDESGNPRAETWEDRFRSFKAAGGLRAASPGLEDDSEAGDTLGSLPALSVVGGKKRRKGASDASGYSMSSSSMFRNKGLSTLDEMFDKVEADYDREDDEDDDEIPDLEALEDDTMSNFSMASRSSRLFKPRGDGEPAEISREDFDNIMDDFLDHYEVVGNRMVPVLEGESGADKLKTMRRALVGLDVEGRGADKVGGGQEEAYYIRKRYLKEDEEEEEAVPDDQVEWPNMPKPKNQWDCETILTTYSNVENHPHMISTRSAKSNGKKKTTTQPAPPLIVEDDTDSGSETEMEDEEGPQRVTVARQKGESKEDKKARKGAVKAERANRRAEKKAKQELFAGERKKQIGTATKRLANGNAADVSVAGREKIGVIALS